MDFLCTPHFPTIRDYVASLGVMWPATQGLLDKYVSWMAVYLALHMHITPYVYPS